MCRATPANGPGESQNAGAVTCRRETPWEEAGGPGFVPLSQGAEKAAGKTGERPETARAGSQLWSVRRNQRAGPQPRAPPGLVGPTSRPGETLLGTFRNLSREPRGQMLPSKDHLG